MARATKDELCCWNITDHEPIYFYNKELMTVIKEEDGGKTFNSS